MRLRWDYLFGGIFIFAVFFFDSLLKAVGPSQTTTIICIGLVGVAVVKIIEYLTEGRQCRCCKKDEEDAEDEDF